MTETAEAMYQDTRRNELLGNALEAYREHKSNTGWKSNPTIQSNMSPLRKFVRALKAELRREPFASDLTSDLVMPIIRECWPPTGETHTHTTNFYRVKGFVRWVAAKHLTGDLDVFIDSAAPKPQEVDTKFLTQEEADRTFEVLHPYAPRDAWMVRINFRLVRRPGELARMKVGDIKLDTAPAYPHGRYTYRETKKSKGLITENLIRYQREALEGWLEEYRTIMGVDRLPGDWYLFPASYASGLSQAGGKRYRKLKPTQPISDVSAAWSRAFKDAEVYEKRKSGHSSRRGGATWIHDSLEEIGEVDPLEHVQRVLGHSDRKTAAIYIKREEGKKKTFQALTRLDEASRAEPPKEQDESQSNAQTGDSGGKVIQVRFGERRRSS